jgi:hypothetical protein
VTDVFKSLGLRFGIDFDSVWAYALLHGRVLGGLPWPRRRLRSARIRGATARQQRAANIVERIARAQTVATGLNRQPGKSEPLRDL